MTNLEIEAFLAIYKTRKISSAAEELFISQSSLSARLQTLEKELDYTLFIRGKGSRTMELTEAGEQFHTLAVSYMDIVRRMRSLKGSHYDQRLRVAAINSIGTYVMMPVYERFMELHPEVYLRVFEYNSDRSKPMIEKGHTDLLFSPGPVDEPDLVSFPIISENICLICAVESEYPEHIDLEILPSEQEIYINWSDAYDSWHRRNFSSTFPHLDLDNMEQLRYFLKQKNRWAFVSGSVTRNFLDDPDIRQLSSDKEIPSRTIFCTCSAKKRNTPEVRAFLECLKKEIKYQEVYGYVKCLLPDPETD